MTVKAKAVKNVAISDKRKKTKKVRKVDAEKLEILTEIAELLTELGYNAEIEKEIAIHFGDYSLKLTRHRPQK